MPAKQKDGSELDISLPAILETKSSMSARTPCSSAASKDRKLLGIENPSSRLEYALCTVPYVTFNLRV
jgi:hypothetical protein